MHQANSPKELKKLLKEDKFPIKVTDEKTIKLVEAMESLKHDGVNEITPNLLAETTIVALTVTAAITVIALYALYKKKNIKIVRLPDGTIVIETTN